MASYLDEFLNKPRNPTNVDIFSGLYNPEQIADLESQYTNQYGIQNTSSGVASDARHMAAMNNLSNSLSPMNNGIGNFIGDTGAFLAGAINELPALGRGFNKENLGEIGEDIVANFKGSYGTPNSTTAEDIYSQVFSGTPMGQRVASGTPMGYGAAQASDLTNLERDFPGMSTGDIIESMNNRPQNLGFIEEAPQVKGMSYEQMVDLGLMGPDQDVGMTAEDLQNRPSFFGNIQNKIGSGLGSLKEFAMNKGTQGFNLARQLPGMALSAMTGIPGIGMALGALGKMGSNEYAQATTANMQKQNNNLQSLGLDGVSNFGGVTTDDLGRITNNGLNYNTPEGIMSGYNSGFDLASAALGRIGTIQNAIDKGRYKNKFAIDRANKKIDNLKTAAVASAQAKRQAYQDKIDNAKNQAAQDRARTKSITAGYGGHDDRPGATGPTAAGANMGVGGGHAADYGFKKDGGMIGYKNGGVASMFTRRG